MRKRTEAYLLFVTTACLVLVFCGCSARAKKARSLEQAGRYFDSGAYENAEIEYLNVLQLDPQDGLASARLGIIYFDQGRVIRAAPYLTKARTLLPNDFALRLRLARTLLATGKLDDAQSEAQFVLDHWPDNPESPLLFVETATTPKAMETARQRLIASPSHDGAPVSLALGNLELRQHRLKEAGVLFSKAQALDPKSADLNTALALMYWAEGNTEKAAQSFATAADASPARSPKKIQFAQFKLQNGDATGARKILEQVTEKAPDLLPAWSLLGEIAVNEHRSDDADAIVAKILAREPSDPSALLLSGRIKLARGENAKAVAEFERMAKMYPQSSQVQYQLGVAYLSTGNVGGAIASLNQAVNFAPNLTEAIVLLAGINIKKGDYSPAVASLKKLTQQRPDLAQPRMLLAEAYRSQGNVTDALAVYRQLEKLFPSNPQSFWLTGLLLVQLKDQAAARKSFEQALTLKKDYLPAVEQLVDLDLAEKQYTTARERLTPYLASNPNVAGLYLLLAQVCLTQKQNDEAEKALKKVIELEPTSAAAYLTLARLYIATNQQQKALASLQDVVGKNPKETAAWMLMAVIQQQEKNYAAAQATYEKLLAVSPNFSPALNNLAYLDSEQLVQLDKAYDYAKKARELSPNEPNTADTLGWILYKKRQYIWALPLLQESARSLGTNPEILFHLGMAYYYNGQTAAANQTLQRARSLSNTFAGSDEANQVLSILAIDPAKAGSDLRPLLEKRAADHPDDSVAITLLADLYLRNGELDKASETYDLALRASPGNAALLASMAKFNDRRQNLPKAYELAKAARKLAPDDPEIAHTLGRIAFHSGDYQWSASLLRESIAREPEAPETLYDLAESLYSIGRVSDARVAMEDALHKKDSLSRRDEAQRFLDLTALAARPADALTSMDNIEQSLKSAPSYLPALVAKAAALDAKDGAARSRSNYENILKLYPDFTPAKKRLAGLYADSSGDLAKAYSLAMKAREDLPDDSELSKTLGVILYRQGDNTRAVEVLKDAASKRPDDAELMYYLGMARFRLKDKPASKDALQRALALKLGDDLAVEAQKTLAELK